LGGETFGAGIDVSGRGYLRHCTLKPSR